MDTAPESPVTPVPKTMTDAVDPEAVKKVMSCHTMVNEQGDGEDATTEIECAPTVTSPKAAPEPTFDYNTAQYVSTAAPAN